MSDNPAHSYTSPLANHPTATATANSSRARVPMLGPDGRETPHHHHTSNHNLNLNRNPQPQLPAFANFTQTQNQQHAPYQLGAPAAPPPPTAAAAAAPRMLNPHLPSGVNAQPPHTPHVAGYAPQGYNTPYQYAQHPHAQGHAQPMYQHHAPPPPPPQQAQLQPDQWSYNLPNGALQAAQQSSSRAYSNSAQYRAPRQRADPYASTVSTGANSYHPGTTYANASGSRAAPNPTHLRSQRHAGSANKTTLGSFKSVADALAGISDESHIIMRFSQFLAESNRMLVPARRRNVILQFTGFPRNSTPKQSILIMLGKAELETLARILGVSHHGRKTDIAARIVHVLREPLFSKPSAQSSRANAERVANGTYGNSNQGNSYYSSAVNPSAAHLNAAQQPRPNMPMMPATASHAYRKHSPRYGRPIASNQDLMSPETPFNLPRTYPLPNPTRDSSFIVFSANELNATGKQIAFLSPNLEELETQVKGKGELQVHLRCLKVEPTKNASSWKQCWPFPSSCTVNTNSVELDQAQRFTNGKLAGRDKGTNITRYLYGRRAGNRPNLVTLRRTTNSTAASTGTFILFAQVILVRSSADMQRVVEENSNKHWENFRRSEVAKGMDPNTSDFELSRRKVQKVMGGGDIAVEQEKIQLRCPLSLLPIRVPVRGKACTHIQCFDLSSFLDYTRRSSKFACPVCSNNDCTPDSLVISWYMQHALKEHEGCDEIEVLKDGSIKPVANVQKGEASMDSDSDFEEPASKRRRTNGIGGAGSSKSAAIKAVVVDLTLDDSDNEAPTPAPEPAQAQAPPQSTTSQRPQQPQPATPQAASATRPTQAISAPASAVIPNPAPTNAPPPPPVQPPLPPAEPENAPAPEAEAPAPPAAEDGEQLEFVFGEGDDPEENEMDAEGELLEYTFSADDRIYPWDMPPKKTGSDEEEEEENDASEEEVEPKEPAQPSAQGQTWENGVEVITIDSD